MDLITLTSLNSYVKQLKLKNNWELKQQTGNYRAKGLSLDDWLDSSQTQKASSVGQSGSHGDEKLTAIHTKLDAGRKLTPEERDYLKDKDPQAYQELVNQERAQKAYEQALRRCKTKEEAQRLQMNHINKSVMVIRSVEHNSHITDQKKLEIAMREKRFTDRIQKSTREFIQKGEYKNLPSEAEETRAHQDRIESLSPAQQDASLNRAPEDTRDNSTNSSQESSRSELSEKRISDREEAVSSAETSARKKVRRAQIKSAYVALNPEPIPLESFFSLDRKV